MYITTCLPRIGDSVVAVTTPLVLGVPVSAVLVELNASVGPLVSPAVVADATKRTNHNKSSEVLIPVLKHGKLHFGSGHVSVLKIMIKFAISHGPQ